MADSVHSSVSLLSAFLLTAIALGACGGPEKERTDSEEAQLPENVHPGRTHPTSSSISTNLDATVLIEKGRVAKHQTEVHKLASRLRKVREPVLTIGTLEGSKYEMIGRVEDVAVGKEGRIHLLDSRYNEIRIYDSNGNFINAFKGTRGSSVDFRAPEALELHGKSQLIVANRLGLVKLFALTQTGVTHQNTIFFSSKTDIDDFCALNDMAYIHGLKGMNVVHAFSLSGKHLRSFGKPYQTKNAFIRSEFSRGQIACIKEADTVISMLNFLPVIRAYSTEGSLKWKSKFANFKHLTAIEEITDQGRLSLSYRKGRTTDVLENVEGIFGKYVVVQIKRTTIESKSTDRKSTVLRTFLVDAQTGEGVYVSNRIPIIYAASGDYIYTGTNASFPQVKVYRLPSGGA